ncbi:MAG TPA: hypothetical protein VLM85_04340 [Polyangiaceae bacterium]|nr:hypothetical protein [Polyangiaceae bacterium]
MNELPRRRYLASLAAVVLFIAPGCSTTPPEVDSVVPSVVCGGGSQLTIDGKSIQHDATVSLDCGGTSVSSTQNTVNADGTEIVATFPPGSVANGTQCDVIVKNGDAADPTPHKTVTVVSGPVVFFVDPSVVYNGISTQITLYATTLQQPLPADAATIVPDGATQPVTTLQVTPVAGHPNQLQATVPSGQAPGSYDLTLKDSTGCETTLQNAFTVTGNLTVTLSSIVNPFGPTSQDTAVTILRDTAAPAPGNAPFVDTPRVFLNPASGTSTDVAVAMQSVTFLDPDHVTGVVPKGTAPKVYDVVLVNPDGTVGVLKNGYTETSTPPPVVLTATPSSIKAATGQAVVLGGTDFATGDTVTLTCVDANGNSVASPTVAPGTPSCTGSNCTQTITIDGSTLAAGDVCVVRLKNSDGTYGDYSAIGVTTPSLNLNSPHKGTDMNVGRRALVAAAGNATTANRFVYAIGGDDGSSAGALDSVEFAPVDVFGKIGAWTTDPVSLPGKRTLAGSATVGRYIYAVGGNDGAAISNTAVRALILSPREAPVFDNVDVALGKQGLDPGTYHYRVSATFSTSDTDNPGGESLASDSFTIKVPTIANDKMSVILTWKAPVDSLGAAVPNVAGYRVYRTAKDAATGSETLLATVSDGATLTWTDDGTATLGTDKPLPLGSTGKWASLPNLGTAREGLAVAWAKDPAAADTFYVYALLGRSTPTVGELTQEFLKVTVAQNGRQTTDAAWTPGNTKSAAGRWQMGAWVADSIVSPLSGYANATWIFVGGGLTAGGGPDNTVEAALVQGGGQLGSFDAGPKDFANSNAGYGYCAANNQLFTFGGQGLAQGATSATLVNPPPGVAVNSWNSEGLTMTWGRYLPGSTLQSSFIFLLGGQTNEPSAASKTTELVIW